MNGPEHYREAERLLGEASELLATTRGNQAGLPGWRDDIAHFLNTRAQVHATLALVAASLPDNLHSDHAYVGWRSALEGGTP